MKNTALRRNDSSNGCLIFRYFSLFLFSSWLVLSSSAFAFGGGGDSRLFDKEWMRGVDAFALHFNGKGELDIKFGECQNGTMNTYGVCGSCNAGYKLENGKCVKDACANFSVTECIKTCTSSNGIATYTYGTACANGYFCNENHQCENPCYEVECQTCTPIAGQPHWTNKANGTTCSIGSCQSGECKDPCDLKTNKEPCKAYTAQSGLCVENGFAPKGTKNCDSEHASYVCNGMGVCTCPDGMFRRDDGSCISCSSTIRYEISAEVTAEACAACDGTENPRMIWKYNNKNYCVISTCPDGMFRRSNGDCASCSTTSIYETTTEACATCDGTQNPRMMWEYNDKNYCVLATCPDGMFRRSNGDCASCSTTSIYETTAEACAACDNTDNPRFMSIDGYCVLCSSTPPYETTAEACAACDGIQNPRMMWEYNNKNYCVHATCPEGQFRWINGDCTSCSTTFTYETTAEACAACDGTQNPRMMWEYNNKNYCVLATCPNGRYRTTKGTCLYCSKSYGEETTAEACAACDTTNNPRFMGSDNNCYPCAHSSSVTATEEACKKCPNRTWTETTPASGDTPAQGTCMLNQ